MLTRRDISSKQRGRGRGALWRGKRQPKRIAMIAHHLPAAIARAAYRRPLHGRVSVCAANGTSRISKVVSLYVDQKPEGDLSGARAKEFGFEVYPTIAEALRCGGDKIWPWMRC